MLSGKGERRVLRVYQAAVTVIPFMERTMLLLEATLSEAASIKSPQ